MTSTLVPIYTDEPSHAKNLQELAQGDSVPPSDDVDQETTRSFPLQYTPASDARRMVEQLLERSRWRLFSLAVDERINTIHVRGHKAVVQEVIDLLELLDVAEPGSNATEFDLQEKALSKPQSSHATDATGESLQQSVADIRQRLVDLDRQSHGLANQLKRPLKDPGEAKELRTLLHDVVLKSFTTRQELRRAELELFTIRLRDLKQSVELRDHIADRIIDRRIEELLDPNVSWEASNESAPLVDGPPVDAAEIDASNVSRPIVTRAFLRFDKNESDDNIQWLVTRLKAIGITGFNVARGSGNANSLDIFSPAKEQARLEREIKGLEKDAPINWILNFATSAPAKDDFKPYGLPKAGDGPNFKNRGDGVGVPLAQKSAAGEQRLWNVYGVTPSPVSDLTAKVLEALGLHLSPISNKQFRGKNVLTKYSGGLDLTFVETGGPAENAGIHSDDIVVAFQGQGVLTLQEFDDALQDGLRKMKSDTSNSLTFDVLRNGETVSLNVPLPNGVSGTRGR